MLIEEFVKRSVEKRGREEKKLQQKTMDVVDGRRSDSLDELLANFEFANQGIRGQAESRSAASTVDCYASVYRTAL